MDALVAPAGALALAAEACRLHAARQVPAPGRFAAKLEASPSAALRFAGATADDLAVNAKTHDWLRVAAWKWNIAA